jgi:hypothetical protein
MAGFTIRVASEYRMAGVYDVPPGTISQLHGRLSRLDPPEGAVLHGVAGGPAVPAPTPDDLAGRSEREVRRREHPSQPEEAEFQLELADAGQIRLVYALIESACAGSALDAAWFEVTSAA